MPLQLHRYMFRRYEFYYSIVAQQQINELYILISHYYASASLKKNNCSPSEDKKWADILWYIYYGQGIPNM